MPHTLPRTIALPHSRAATRPRRTDCKRRAPQPLRSAPGPRSGGKLSLTALANSPRYDLRAMADMSAEARAAIAEMYPGIQTFESHEQLFEACPTDVVCVSTWPPTHEPITRAALQLPVRGLLVEKPLGHTAASGRRVLQMVREADVPVVVPHSQMAQKMPLEIIQRVRAGEIGELKLMEVQCTRWDIINAGIHWALLFVMLTGNEPIDHVMATCECSTRTYRDGMQVETTGVTYVVTQSGTRMVMNTGDEVPVNRTHDGKTKGNCFRILGSAGFIDFSWAGDTDYFIMNSQHPAGEAITPGEFDVMRHQRHLEYLADQIENGQRDHTIPEASLKALELCEAAYLASEHNCKVTFPLEQFEPPAEQPDWQPGVPYSGAGGGRDGRKLG